MPLDPQAKAILDASPDMPEFDTMDAATVRASMAGGDALSPGDPLPVARVENRSIPGPGGAGRAERDGRCGTGWRSVGRGRGSDRRVPCASS